MPILHQFCTTFTPFFSNCALFLHHFYKFCRGWRKTFQGAAAHQRSCDVDARRLQSFLQDQDRQPCLQQGKPAKSFQGWKMCQSTAKLKMSIYFRSKNTVRWCFATWGRGWLSVKYQSILKNLCQWPQNIHSHNCHFIKGLASHCYAEPLSLFISLF